MLLQPAPRYLPGMATRSGPPTVTALRRLATDLEALKLPWALVGGLAVSAHTGAGALDDIDVALAVADDDTAEAVVRALHERGYAALTTIEDEGSGRLASVRLEFIGEEGRVEPLQLLFASSGIEPELVARASSRPVANVRCPVASVGHLLALKMLSHGPARPQDGQDIAALLRAASEDDLQEAEDAFVLITDRGLSRGRDLLREYQAFLAREPGAGDLG